MRKKGFWNKEYTNTAHLALSTEPSEDLVKFTRFLMRQSGKELLNVTRSFVDLGCGNGRNSLFLYSEFGMRGLGYDLSSEAVHAARNAAAALQVESGAETPFPVEFTVRDLREPIPLPDTSTTLALDMMSSHVLKRDEREALRTEILRVLKPGGWLFFRTFLRDEDQHAERMLRDYPGPEEGMYVHPDIKKPEYVWFERDLYSYFQPFFTIHKLERSHKHLTKHGEPWKRRTASLYLQKF